MKNNSVRGNIYATDYLTQQEGVILKVNGSVQIKNNKYYAVFRLCGKQKWVQLKTPVRDNNKSEAETELKTVLEKYSAQPSLLTTEMLFTDFLLVWVNDIKPTVKPVTWETYNKVVREKLLPYFKDKNYRLVDLRGAYFTEYFVYLRDYGKSKGKCGLSKKTVLNIRGVVSSALRYAMENDIIAHNVVNNSRMPLFEFKQSVHNIYTPEQLKQLLEYAEKTDSSMQLFLNLVIYTGARKGELLGLTWNDVDFDNSTIHICHNRTGSKKEVLDVLTTPKTVNGIRTLYLPPKVIQMLREEKQKQENNQQRLKVLYQTHPYDFVIRQENGSVYNPNSINRIIKKMECKIGLPECRVHDFRHAVASMLFDNGIPLPDITTQLGHGQTSTTERIYIHKSNTANTANVRLLSGLIG